MATQDERRTATRAAILASAGQLFGVNGYEATSVEDILNGAGISRGALYHHFASKEDVFAAVFSATSADAVERAARHVKPGTLPLQALIDGCIGWLDGVADPAVQRILLVDGPAALGWERARLLEEASSLGLVRLAVGRAVRSGEIQVPSIDLAAKVINAMLGEVALSLGVRPLASRRRAAQLVAGMINGLATTSTQENPK